MSTKTREMEHGSSRPRQQTDRVGLFEGPQFLSQDRCGQRVSRVGVWDDTRWEIRDNLTGLTSPPTPPQDPHLCKRHDSHLHRRLKISDSLFLWRLFLYSVYLTFVK